MAQSTNDEVHGPIESVTANLLMHKAAINLFWHIGSAQIQNPTKVFFPSFLFLILCFLIFLHLIIIINSLSLLTYKS